MYRCHVLVIFFFFNDTATTEIYTLSLHDALPICDETTQVVRGVEGTSSGRSATPTVPQDSGSGGSTGTARQASKKKSAKQDRKSTRLNSSHANISYAVFCLKKKNTKKSTPRCCDK